MAQRAWNGFVKCSDLKCNNCGITRYGETLIFLIRVAYADVASSPFWNGHSDTSFLRLKDFCADRSVSNCFSGSITLAGHDTSFCIPHQTPANYAENIIPALCNAVALPA